MRKKIRALLLQLGMAFVGGLTVLSGGVLAQGAFPQPTQLTMDAPGKRPNSVYAPRLVEQVINGTSTLVMYFGGWYQTDPTKAPNDSIYRSICSAPNACGTPQLVINPVAFGLGSASLANNPSIVELHNNGQDYYVMYLVVVPGTNPNAGFTSCTNQIYYSTSFANDGINWSKPVPLGTTTAWLPSVTLDGNSPPHVIMYATSNYTPPASIPSGVTCPNQDPNQPFLARYDLGTSGVSVSAPVAVTTLGTSGQSLSYYNVSVRYRPSLNPPLYQMLAQQFNLSSLNSEIDSLYSTDGITFKTLATNVTPQGLTPASHPGTDCWVYYGVATSTDVNIFMKSWC